MRDRKLALFVAVASVVLVHVRDAAAGYTHYWKWHSSQPDAAALERCRGDMLRVVEARRDILVIEALQVRFGDGGVVEEIAFNGIGEDGHESFGFPLAAFTADEPSFQFVKTAGKPYDEVVAACLIVARDCFEDDVLSIHSDGQWPDDWARGARLYERVLHRPAHNPLTPFDAASVELIDASRADSASDAGPVDSAPRPEERTSYPAFSLGWRRVLLVVVFAGAIALLLRRS